MMLSRTFRRAAAMPAAGILAAGLLAIPVPALAQHGSPPTSGPRSYVQDGKIFIMGVPYQKLDTREATETRIVNTIYPTKLTWGPWHVITPFQFDRPGQLSLKGAPEDDLGKMAANGPGPDLAKPLKGHKDKQVRWLKIGDISNTKLDLNQYQEGGFAQWMASYLYATVTSEDDFTTHVTMGSDDGLRFWVNGKLLVDADEQRGLDPENHRVRIDFKKGVNHILAKISQGPANFDFQINTRKSLDSYSQSLLDYALEVDFPSTAESEYYKVYSILLPNDLVMEVGGLATLPDGRPIVSTRRGDIYIVDGAYNEPAFNCKFTRFAQGLHEPLGLAVRAEKSVGGKDEIAVYCVQRGELTRLVDTTGDWIADEYRTFSDGWGVSGNYHEFSFGPKFDMDGNFWVTLNVGFCGSLGKAVVPWRGWGLKIDGTGSVEPICGGMRSPNGIGCFTDGQMFYVDNQGDYVGTNRIQPIVKGGFMGHPAGLRWQAGYKDGDPSPPVQPAAIWFPYPDTGQSAADFLTYAAQPTDSALDWHPDGKSFGPFAGQVFVGDQTLCYVNRVCLEKVRDTAPGEVIYQGAVFPFRQGLQCGVNRLAWGKDGSMFVGQTDRGWGSIGRQRYGLERIEWTGKVPFEIQTMTARSDGFELVFTEDVDPATAAKTDSYQVESYTYEYHPEYGSKEMETRRLKVTGAQVTDPRTVRISIDGLRDGGMGYVHELNAAGVLSKANPRPLLHPKAFYTLQRIPKATASR
ncbi:MAG: hypothetical protein IT435_03975 [Phycisphaerales bacterium]|nr:hypothetical protein [Phycisphaerales bacterium]